MFKAFRKKGFRQFFLRTIIYFGVLFAVQFGIFLFFSKTTFFSRYLAIPTTFYFQFLEGLSKQDFLNSLIFVVVAFLLWRRKDILNFKADKQNYRQTIVFSILSVVSLLFHYVLKYWVVSNLNLALQHVMLITLLKYGFDIISVLFLAFAVYNTNFIKFFIKNYYKNIIFFTIMLFLYYRLIGWFQDSWLFFSTTVGSILSIIFSKFFDNVVFYATAKGGPVLGVNGFRVGISKVCSGIDSLLFFISLFAILVVLNWRELDKKRMAMLFIPGAIGTFFLNILRVFLIIIMAVNKNPLVVGLLKSLNTTPEQFAVDLFHTNAGWILFLGYFVAFWHFGSKWVVKNG